MSDYFDAVDALLAVTEPLPDPAERRRLREAGGLSQEQIGRALEVAAGTVASWESGRTEPKAPKRAAYARLLEGLAARFPAAEPAAEPVAERAPEPVAEPVPEPAAAPVPPPAPESRPPAPRPVRKAVRRPAAEPVAADPRFASGPLVVLDGDGTAHGIGGLVLDCPAATVPELVEWALGERLGSPRLHRNGKDADPLVVLTAPAAERLGLPAELADRRGLRLAEDHPVVRQIARAQWQLTRRGFGPWARVYRPARDGRRQCVQLAVLPWGALDDRAWGSAAGLAPARLADVLGDYAARVLTPRGSTATNGLELMSALRPPTRAALDDATGRYVSRPVPGSFSRPIDPAPPEAPDEHPVARGRRPGDAMDEEAYDWHRPIELLTDEECALPYVVGLDVNMAFAAAANRLNIGTGEPLHVRHPAFDPKMPGCWHVDLTHARIDPRLPSPFTPSGEHPSGPAWYATPTVAYAAELGFEVRPSQAWIRPEHGPYFDPWYARLRDAYLATMAELGVTPGMDEAAFLAAMEVHKSLDPGRAALLSAIKATVKGGIGKLRERPQGARYRPGDRWPALERPNWSPHARSQVIANNRIGQARKLAAWARHGRYPVAVLADCAVYPSPGRSASDAVPRTPDGKPVPGGFRLGVSPGMVKLEGVREFYWAADLIEAGHNPGRHIKGVDAAFDGE